MAMFGYLVMAGWSAASLIWNTRLSAMMAQALAPTGAMFAFIVTVDRCLLGPIRPGARTGSGMHGSRPTLILFFLYLGFLALRAAIEDPRRADRASALLALVGAINVPIIYFSVKWWNTLHQGASVSLNAAPKMAADHARGHAHHDVRRLVLRDRRRRLHAGAQPDHRTRSAQAELGTRAGMRKASAHGRPRRSIAWAPTARWRWPSQSN
jgi:hypothetical protein